MAGGRGKRGSGGIKGALRATVQFRLESSGTGELPGWGAALIKGNDMVNLCVD